MLYKADTNNKIITEKIVRKIKTNGKRLQNND